MKQIFPILAVTLVISGCITPPVKQSVAYDETAFARYAERGSSSIYGDAFLKTKGGETRTAAGIPIYLVPLTSYTNERGKIMWERKEPESADPRLARFVRTTKGDSQGRFAFSNLPAGSYLIYCKIEWMLPDGSTTGGYALGRAKVEEGKRARVLVTR